MISQLSIFHDDFVGVMIDRFGRDIPIYAADRSGWSETSVEVSLSDHFYGWIFALGENVRITGPETVVESFKKELEQLRKLYR